MIAPPKSPNTDGIDISNSIGLRIVNSSMETGTHCFTLSICQAVVYICSKWLGSRVGYHKRG